MADKLDQVLAHIAVLRDRSDQLELWKASIHNRVTSVEDDRDKFKHYATATGVFSSLMISFAAFIIHQFNK